ncbi:hypothetical protein KC333_g2090 [Hortaea werneckii]|nr:hypothetical protein KC333_g2090 [Hortaea werneckii]KAI7321049.1 hypothetical protein KC326_g2429 [Hortaea werneckii]
MSGLNVLISGASIAGPLTAHFLARAGATVTIVERFPELRTAGQNVDIRSLGVTVMRKIPGFEEAVRAKTTQMDAMVLVDAIGKEYARMGTTGDPDQQSLVSEFEIFRGDLARILYDMTKEHPRINYVFDEQISSLAHSHGPDGPITVSFANSTPATTYDLVVAADGATSRTRGLGLNCSVRDHIHSMNTWAAYFSIVPDLIEGSKAAYGHNAIPGKAVFLGPDPFRTNTCRAGVMRVYPKDQVDATAPFQQAQKAGLDSLKAFVGSELAGLGWKSQDILSGLKESDDFYASEIVQVKVPQLSQGRFVLVGDAGYAGGPTGTGTSLAMTGAYVLAGELSRACQANDKPTCTKAILNGLKGYEERMKPIIAEMQKIPPGMPQMMAPQTQLGLWFRNLILRLVIAVMSLGSYLSWISAYLPAAFNGGDRYDLPDYEWTE